MLLASLCVMALNQAELCKGEVLDWKVTVSYWDIYLGI